MTHKVLLNNFCLFDQRTNIISLNEYLQVFNCADTNKNLINKTKKIHLNDNAE